MDRRRPPRIRGFTYVGRYAYFLTICAEDRHPAFVQTKCAQRVCEQLLRTSADYAFAVIAYCLMPDHMHALIEGLTLNSNFRKFASMFKQRSAFEYQQSHGRRLWQDGYYEHTLREHESQIGIAAYIINNPIRASLCTSLENYAYLGSDRFTIRELCDAIQTPPCTRP